MFRIQSQRDNPMAFPERMRSNRNAEFWNAGPGFTLNRTHICSANALLSAAPK